MRIVAIVIIGASVSALAARQPAPAAVYTARQAEAGSVAIQRNAFGDCSSCHTVSLTGRTGAEAELPPLASLPPDYQKLVAGNGGRVPPLVGTGFVSRWSGRSTKQLVEEFDKRFSPPLTSDTRLEIIAYMLKASGATVGAEPLTAMTDVPIASLFQAP